MATITEQENIIGGVIPKIRIERISLSNGGRLIIEDNPHILEDVSNVSFGIDEKIATAVDDWYGTTSPNISTAKKSTYVRKAWANLTTETYNRMMAYTDAQQLYELIGGSETPAEVERLKRQYAHNIVMSNLIKEFLGLTPAVDAHGGFVKFGEEHGLNSSTLGVTVSSYELVDGIPGTNELKGATLRASDVQKNLSLIDAWMRSPNLEYDFGGNKMTLSSLGRTPLSLYESLGPTISMSSYIGQNYLVTVLKNSFVPLIYMVFREALELYLDDLTDKKSALRKAATVNAVQLDPRNLSAAKGTGLITVDLLLNVSAIQSDTASSPSWMSDQKMVDNLEFLVVASTELKQINNIKTAIKEYASSKKDKYEQLSSLLAINLDAAPGKVPFIDLRSDLKTPETTVKRFNLGDKLKTSLAAAQREYTIDNDGDRIYEFNFNVNYEFPAEPREMTFFIIPFLNLPSYIGKLKESASEDLKIGLEDFRQYLDYFVGKVSIDTVLKNGAIQSTANMFIDSGTGEQWVGEVHYHPPSSPRSSNYVGWMGGERHQPNLTQPKLSLIQVVNNKIQDNRKVERLEDFERDLSPTNKNEFNPPVTIQGNNVEKPGNAYFSNMEFSRDINSTVSIFFGVNVESIVQRRTIFGSLYKNLNEEEKRELIKNIQFNSFKVVRRQVRESNDQNYLGGPGKILNNLHRPKYGVHDEIIVATNETALKSFENSKGSVREITSFLNNLRSGTPTVYSARSFGSTRFFSVKDKTSSDAPGGRYQYGVELEVLDKTLDFFKKRKGLLETSMEYLNQYYLQIMDNSNYNFATDKITQDYIKAFNGLEVSVPVIYKPALKNPHILSSTVSSTSNYLSSTAEGPRSYILKVPDKVRNTVSELSDINGTFINMLRILSANVNTFDPSEISLTIKNFLHPTTASRESVLRIVNLISNLISKLDNLIGVNVVPSTSADSGPQKTSPGKKTNKMFYLSDFASTVINTTMPSGNGYYYMVPDEGLASGATPRGIREISAEFYRSTIQEEINKCFYDGSDTPSRVLDFVSDQEYSYLSPRIISLSQTGTGKKVSTNIFERKDLIIFEHRYDLEAPTPQFVQTIGEYQLLVSRIRTLNSMKKINPIPAVNPADYGKYTFPSITLNALVRGAQEIKSSLRTNMELRNCTIYTKDSHNALLGRVTKGIYDIEFLEEEKQKKVLATNLLGVDDGFNAEVGASSNLDDTSKNTKGMSQNTVKQTYRIPSQMKCVQVFGATLDVEAPYLTPTKLNMLLNSPETKNKYAHSFSYNNYKLLPTQVKMLHRPNTRAATAANLLNTVGNNFQNPSFSGLMDIHINRVVEVQVLDGYEMNAYGELLLDKPKWKKIAPEDLQSNIVCRLIPYQHSTIQVGHPNYLEMPVFDKIFMIRGQSVTDETKNPILNPAVADVVSSVQTSANVEPKYIETGIL